MRHKIRFLLVHLAAGTLLKILGYKPLSLRQYIKAACKHFGENPDELAKYVSDLLKVTGIDTILYELHEIVEITQLVRGGATKDMAHSIACRYEYVAWRLLKPFIRSPIAMSDVDFLRHIVYGLKLF